MQSLGTGLTKEVQLAIANIYLPKGSKYKDKREGKGKKKKKYTPRGICGAERVLAKGNNNNNNI